MQQCIRDLIAVAAWYYNIDGTGEGTRRLIDAHCQDSSTTGCGKK